MVKDLAWNVCVAFNRRKWRMPVNTIAIPAASAAAISLGELHRAPRLDDRIPPTAVRRRTSASFADGLLSAIEAGATAVIEPGGSMRDAEVIAAADAAGIAMVFTGIRHFRH